MVYIFFYPCHPHLMFLNYPVIWSCIICSFFELCYIKQQMRHCRKVIMCTDIKILKCLAILSLLCLQEYAIERLESYFQLKNKLLNGAAISGGPGGGVKRKIHELESWICTYVCCSGWWDSFMKSVCDMLAQRLPEVGRWCIGRIARVHIHFMVSIFLSIRAIWKSINKIRKSNIRLKNLHAKKFYVKNIYLLNVNGIYHTNLSSYITFH